MIERVSGLAVNQRVNVTGKIQSVEGAEKVEVKSRGGTLTKQDFVVVDCTGIALSEVLPGKKIVYWSLVALMNITIRSFNGVRYLLSS